MKLGLKHGHLKPVYHVGLCSGRHVILVEVNIFVFFQVLHI